MVRSKDSNIVQRILSRVFTALGGAFIALAILLLIAMNWFPASCFTLFIVSIPFLSVGVPFLIVGMSFYVYLSVKEKEKERLITDGYRVSGKIIDYKVNHQVRLNRKCPVKLICETDGYDYNENKRYISDNYWGDPELLINSNVTIYIDREKGNHYYVDISKLD